MSWHVSTEVAQRYADRRVDPTTAASIEAHLLSCHSCRAAVGGASDQQFLAAVWDNLNDELDRPSLSWFETMLRRLGCSEATARIAVATSRAHWAYLAAAGLSLFLAFVASHSSTDEVLGLFLVVAPLGPLVATIAAFGGWLDRSADLIDTMPTSALRILLVRTATSVVPALVVTAASLPWLLDRGVVAIGWLLPSLALTVGAIALSTWVSVEFATGTMGALWVAAVLALRFRTGELVALFGTPLQVVSVSVTIAALVVACLRRTAFEYRSA